MTSAISASEARKSLRLTASATSPQSPTVARKANSPCPLHGPIFLTRKRQYKLDAYVSLKIRHRKSLDIHPHRRESRHNLA